MKSVFVTVSTTSFDELNAAARSPPALQALQSRGYQKLVLQAGRGSLPQPSSSPAAAVEAFRFKDSLAEELQSADLVISHTGAGSCLETLENGKPLIVVINDKLMNHQLELAKQLHRDGCVLYCNCRYGAAGATMQSMDLSALKPFPPGQPEKFASFLNKVLGLQ
ncbi:UDP-N-acetylglucosamine transferase subunit ALG13 homolog isoform X1 [Melozone crissalis]|uniref:UDP-N-acetylglucosamine transferase subunit ALG13 homolog isoform X1 n=1 Tax=Melozone crissalis TaxID=40204 RepID=UPI0023DB6480|nr:UDP-N-acetylglucosamine transferase subunit ALG13 homolog isoform X1 [Melozone crissalis]